jgi:hypothetical protein
MGAELNIRTAIPTETITKIERRMTRAMRLEEVESGCEAGCESGEPLEA